MKKGGFHGPPFFLAFLPGDNTLATTDGERRLTSPEGGRFSLTFWFVFGFEMDGILQVVANRGFKMIAASLRDFIDRILDFGEMDETDVALLRANICPQGIDSRAEADALIALDRLVDVPEAWGDFLVDVIVSFTRCQMTPAGSVPADFVSWLVSSLDTGRPTERAVRIASTVVVETRCVDEYLRRFAKLIPDIRSAA